MPLVNTLLARAPRQALIVGVTALTLTATPMLPASSAPSVSSQIDRQDNKADKAPGKARPTFRVATLNLKNTMSSGAVSHDINKVLKTSSPSIIGFQERGGTEAMMRRALPKNWRLVMPHNTPGTDLNPVAFDKKVFRYVNSWPELLTGNTWRRRSGKIAVDQYGVVAVLQHRETKQVFRTMSFHMPPNIHNHRSGGPNPGGAVEAFYRMASKFSRFVGNTPDYQQFIAMCDCNVAARYDRTKKMLNGRVLNPMDLRSNYDAEEAPRGWSIDYVITETEEPYKLISWRGMTELATDHPAVIAKFRLKENAVISDRRPPS